MWQEEEKFQIGKKCGKIQNENFQIETTLDRNTWKAEDVQEQELRQEGSGSVT